MTARLKNPVTTSDSRDRLAPRGPTDGLASALLTTMHWGAALQGKGALPEAVSQVVAVTGARVGRLVQVTEDTRREVGLAFADLGGGRGQFPPPADLCDLLLRAGICRARPGSVWRYSEIRDHSLLAPTMRVGRWFETRGIAELVHIVLSTEARDIFLLELGFPSSLAPGMQAMIEAMAPALSLGWSNRDPNLLSRVRRSGLTLVQTETAAPEPILSDANPAGLTRAEFRICLLLADGHAARDLTAELRISEPTLRSHLRNIYAKTETCGQAELIHRLLAHGGATRGGGLPIS